MAPGKRALHASRELVAFALSPLIVPFVYLLPFPGKTNPAESVQVSMLEGVITTWAFAVVSVLPLAYLAEAVLGVPAWLLYKASGFRSIGAFVAGGASIGVLVYGGLVTLAGNWYRESLVEVFNPTQQPYLWLCIVGAVASALVFRGVVGTIHGDEV